MRASEQDRADIQLARRRWRRRQAGWDSARLVFLDESGAKTNMTRLRGRALRGKRVHASAPCGHWKITTMISSIRLDNTTGCMTIESATDTEVFRTYLKKVHLSDAQARRHRHHGQSASAQKRTHSGAHRTGSGHPLFLPAYSPDLNPIEKMWSKIKHSLRSAEARTTDQLRTAIADALHRVTPKEAPHWFATCSYSFI